MRRTHFKTHVDSALRQKIYDIVNEASFHHLLKGAIIESMGDTNYTEAIEGNWVSGWVPKQDGGYSRTILLRNDIDPSYHISEKQTDFINAKHEQMLKEFIQDFGISCESDIDYDDDELMESLREYEDETFDYAVLEFRAYVRARDVVLEITLDYGPDLEIIKECSISIPGFMKADNEWILDMVKVADKL